MIDTVRDGDLSKQVRVRYAPSPTGLQHIGGLRTALFNYLFARSSGGIFILRLEDTDRTRFDQRFVQNLYDTFSWIGFRWDEGPDIGGSCAPYIQSERFALYKDYAQKLVDAGQAYYCFCSSERLDAVRKEREAAHSSQSGYDRFCRSLDSKEAQERAASGEPHTIRLKIPLKDADGTALLTRFHDELLGDIEWKNEDISPDPVLVKSDGFPTYHLANVLDDHLMGVSHVLRAQEWLPSTPLHIIMYKAFNWEPPRFCHLPMVLGQDGKKLSKRHGATSIDEFRRQGYLPEALVNYTALLGASYEEGKDLYTLDELASRFSLEKLNKAPAVFDYKKLEWYNAQYLRQKDDAALAAIIKPYGIEAGLFGTAGRPPLGDQEQRLLAAIPLIRERISFPQEAPPKLHYLFNEPKVPPATEFTPKKMDSAKTLELLKLSRDIITEAIAAETDSGAQDCVKAFAERHKVKLGDLLTPLRAAITGSRVSPPLFASLQIIGAEEAFARIDRAIRFLEQA
ncbi:glutamate--tRNA ligase [Breznakiellaceae bacterium SP9]